MATGSSKQNEVRSPDDLNKQVELMSAKLDNVLKHIDVTVNLLLETLLSDPPNVKSKKAVPYSLKAIRLESLGLDVSDISHIVNKPSNWVSSRLREQRAKQPPKPQKDNKHQSQPARKRTRKSGHR